MKILPEPRILLVQVRSQRDAERQEIACFRERLAVGEAALSTWNVVDRPLIRWRDVAGADAVILGGAGAHSVTREYPFTEPLTEVVLRLLEDDRPVFGSCWGHQFLASILGGTVATDPLCEEIGTFDVELTAAGAADPLFAGFPARFASQLGHHDLVTELPPGAIELAFSTACRNQAMRLEGKPVYGTQFHPELSRVRIRERLLMYRDGYLRDGGEAQVDAMLAPSPDADRLLERFVELVAGRRGGWGGGRRQTAVGRGVSLTLAKAR